MIVAVPTAHDRLHRATVPSITAQGHTAHVYTCPDPPHPASYPGVLRAFFRSGESFCIVEHDIESLPGALAALTQCEQPWCWNAYDLDVPFDATGASPQFAMLGHTRFRPVVGLMLGPLLDTVRWWRHWDGLDLLIHWRLRRRLAPHRHYPDVIHHHEYPRRDA